MNRFTLLLTLLILFLIPSWVQAGGQIQDALPSKDGKIVAIFKTQEIIQRDTCYPNRKNFKREMTWYVVQFSDRTILLDPNAVIVNPVEHPILTFKENFSFEGRGHTKDSLKMTYGQFGVLSSDLTVNLHFQKDRLTGTFTNNLAFDPGTLGFDGLKLWVRSHEALRNVPIRVDSIATISVEKPCILSGIYKGVKLQNFITNFSPLKKMRYLREMKRAEEFFSLADYENELKILDKISHFLPQSPDPYWHKARALFAQNELLDPEDQRGRLKLLNEAEKNAQKSVKLNDQSAESWFWYTAIKGRKATTKGILSAIRVTGQLEKGFLKTLNRNPRYNFAGFATAGDTNCGLGIYYRLVPDWWIVKVLTGSRGNIDRAVYYNRQAIRYHPYRVEYHKELGISLLCRGLRQNRQADIQEGLKVLKKTLTFPNIIRTDPIDKHHIEELLQNYQKACAYSRDGYEDLSEETFENSQNGSKTSK